MKKFHTSILLLIIGIGIVKSQITFSDGCRGMVEMSIAAILSFLYILILVLSTIISGIKYFKKKGTFNYFPLVTTIIFFAVIFTSLRLNKWTIHMQAMAYIEQPEKSALLILTLKENGSFSMSHKQSGKTCFYKGKYEINQDTVSLLRRDIQSMTDSFFSNNYLIDADKHILYPLDRSFLIEDTTRNLTIIINKD